MDLENAYVGGSPCTSERRRLKGGGGGGTASAAGANAGEVDENSALGQLNRMRLDVTHVGILAETLVALGIFRSASTGAFACDCRR